MRLLFASYSGGLGGAERVLLDHAMRVGGHVVVACPPGPLAAAARASGLGVVALTSRPVRVRGRAAPRALGALGAYALELRRATDACAADVVVLSGMRPALASLVTAARRRHAAVFLHQDLAPGPLLAGAVRLAAARCDAVVALSEAIARDLRLPASVLRPGTDLVRFAPTPPPATPRVLVLGALTAWKRPDLALEVVARAARLVPDVTVTLAGAPMPGDSDAAALLARLHARARERDLAGRVTFAGAVDAAVALPEHALLLHAADREPYGMALVEALAAGRAVVAPASAGPAEIVDSACGRLYSPGDPAAAAHALVVALADAPRLGAGARARAEARFDVASSARRLRAVLAQVHAVRG